MSDTRDPARKHLEALSKQNDNAAIKRTAHLRYPYSIA